MTFSYYKGTLLSRKAYAAMNTVLMFSWAISVVIILVTSLLSSGNACSIGYLPGGPRPQFPPVTRPPFVQDIRSLQKESLVLVSVKITSGELVSAIIDLDTGSVVPSGVPENEELSSFPQLKDPSNGHKLLVEGSRATLTSPSSILSFDFQSTNGTIVEPSRYGYFVSPTFLKAYVLYETCQGRRCQEMAVIVDVSPEFQDSPMFVAINRPIYKHDVCGMCANRTLDIVYEDLSSAWVNEARDSCGGGTLSFLYYTEDSLTLVDDYDSSWGLDRLWRNRNTDQVSMYSFSQGTQILNSTTNPKILEAMSLQVCETNFVTGEELRCVDFDWKAFRALDPDLPTVAPTLSPAGSPTAQPTAEPTTTLQITEFFSGLSLPFFNCQALATPREIAAWERSTETLYESFFSNPSSSQRRQLQDRRRDVRDFSTDIIFVRQSVELDDSGKPINTITYNQSISYSLDDTEDNNAVSMLTAEDILKLPFEDSDAYLEYAQGLKDVLPPFSGLVLQSQVPPSGAMKHSSSLIVLGSLIVGAWLYTLPFLLE